MAFKVGVGKSDFEEIRKSDNYYVDKTDIMYELVEETDHKVTLFTRPRRFGKTLTMSMMLNFFSIRKDSRSIFEGLKITEHKEFCEKWMNQYPVLFISLKDVEAGNFNDAYEMLQIRIADLCKEYADLLEMEPLDKDDKEIFLRLKSKKSSQGDIRNSLKTIMRMMHAVYGKKIILLIDEYDVPLAGASEKDSLPESLLGRAIMSTQIRKRD